MAVNVEDMWRVPGNRIRNGSLVVGTNIKSKLGLQPNPLSKACYAIQQGDPTKNDELQGNQLSRQLNERLPAIVMALRVFREVSQDQRPCTLAAAGDVGFKVLTSACPAEKTKKLSAELGYGRLISMFFQDGLTGSCGANAPPTLPRR